MEATTAVFEKEEARLGAEATASPASTLSSLRVHPDRFVISAGQTTRLKFALCHVSINFRVGALNFLPGERCVFEPVKPPSATGPERLWETLAILLFAHAHVVLSEDSLADAKLLGTCIPGRNISSWYLQNHEP